MYLLSVHVRQSAAFVLASACDDVDVNTDVFDLVVFHRIHGEYTGRREAREYELSTHEYTRIHAPIRIHRDLDKKKPPIRQAARRSGGPPLARLAVPPLGARARAGLVPGICRLCVE